MRLSGPGADAAADFAEGRFDGSVGGAEGIAVDGEGGSDHDERGTVLWALHGLFEREATDCLDGDGDCGDHFAELVERAGHAVAGCGDAAAFVVSGVMDDEVAAEVFQFAGSRHHVRAGHVVAHDLDTEIVTGLDDALDGFRVGAGHHDDVGGSGFGHHFRFEVAPVHGFEVGYDGDAWESAAECADPVESFCEEKGSACFQPVDASAQGHGCGFEGFVDIGEVERDLDDGFHGWGGGGVGNQARISRMTCPWTSVRR